jgi:hypothetical protein
MRKINVEENTSDSNSIIMSPKESVRAFSPNQIGSQIKNTNYQILNSQISQNPFVVNVDFYIFLFVLAKTKRCG